MKKENILKQVVLQEYGEKKHSKLTKSQLSLSPELYSEVKSMYKELGGTQEDPPLTFGPWDISTPEFIIELDEENQLNSKDAKEGKLALFRCKVNGEDKYVIPIYGNGLWGPINGFIAINGDKRTVFGAYFNHESETAGLGAEIKDNKAWQDLFKGKHLFSGNDTQKIALAVEKKIEDPSTQVDAVTGATLTSNGVTEMFHADKGGLQPYVKFLNSK